jgi:hypothetical protein
MSSADLLAREMAAMASVMLDQGKLADRMSRGLTIASLVGTVALAGHGAIPAMTLIGAAALVGLVELWFAARVAVDAALFRRLSREQGSPDWALLDSALTELRLLPADKAGRPAAARIAGAFRLLRLQIITLLVQFGLIVAGAAAGAAR